MDNKSDPVLIETMRQLVSATLTASIVAAANRPHSVEEVMKITRDVQFTMYPMPTHGSYIEWKKNAKLNEPHK